MSYRFQTEHYEMVLKAGDMERVLPRLAWHLEEPRVGQSYPNFYVAQLASKFVKVVLCGRGRRRTVRRLSVALLPGRRNDSFEHYIDKYYLYWQRLVDNRHLRPCSRRSGSDVERVWTRDIFRDVFQHHARCGLPTGGLHQPLAVLRSQDLPARPAGRRGQAEHGARPGDARAVPRQRPGGLRACAAGATQAGQPGRGRAHQRERAGRQDRPSIFETNADGKLILRDVMGRYIPAEITEAEKQGFSAPDASWFKGESIEYVRRMLMGRDADLQLLDRDAVHALVDEHLEGRQNRRLLIWSLLNVEQWLATFEPER